MSSVITSGLAAAPWRFLLSPPQDGATNMGTDLGLMDRARTTGECVLRVYAWSRPTISLGRNQRVAGRYDAAKIRGFGLDVVRRPTGGRTILHYHEVTYSVTAPDTSAGPLGAAYAWINDLVVGALTSLGVTAEVASPAARTPATWTSPCFARLSRGEITAAGRKLVGSAQFRQEGAILQHGSILVRDDQSLLAKLAAPGDEPVPAPATLSELLDDEPTPAEFGAALRASLHSTTGAYPAPLDGSEVASLCGRHVGEFLDERWTWRA